MQHVENISENRVCFLTDSINGGGIGTVFLALASAMQATGIRVDIVVFVPPTYDVPQGLNVIVLATRTHRAGFGLARYMRAHKPQMIICARDYVGAVAVVARALSGQRQAKLVWSFHTQHSVDTQNRSWKRRMLALFASRMSIFVDHFVGVSRGVSRDLEMSYRLPEGCVKTIYNPVTLPNVTSGPVHAWLAQNEVPVVVACGRLVEQKGFDVLMAAIEILHASRPIRLLVLGEGPLREKLNRQIKTAGLQEDVSLIGVVAHPAAYMKDAACFVMSSHWEGFGMVLAEAMAVGCPVVSTRCPSGPAEVLEEGKYGALVPVGDPVALAQAIHDTLEAPFDPNPARASLARFDPQKIAHQYLELM